MIDVALFGAGRIGTIHAGNVARQPGVRLKYVVDVDEKASGKLAQQHGAQAASAETAFGDASVGAVVIGSSTDTHADFIMRAAKARKAIFCEKPVDLALDRARACAEAVKAAGVTCLIGFQRRYDPTFAALKSRIAAGEIGEPEMLIVTSRDPGAPPVDYIKRSGGIFKDMLIHDFDIFRWILDDEAASVYATGSCLTDPGIEAAGETARVRAIGMVPGALATEHRVVEARVTRGAVEADPDLDLARRIVARAAEELVLSALSNEIQAGVPAGHDEHHRRQRQLAILQHERFDVPGQMMHRDQRHTGGSSRCLRERHTDQQ